MVFSELFGKKKMSENEAAGQFVFMTIDSVQKQWPDIVNDLKNIIPFEESILEDHNAVFEFVLAVIATQLQALPNLLPTDQANRIRNIILQCISSPELGTYPYVAIQAYQNAWDQSLQQLENPGTAIASVLFDKLGIRSRPLLGVTCKSPLILMALTEKVYCCIGPFWKNLTQKYKLIP